MIVSFLETDNHDLALVDMNLFLCSDARAIQAHVEARLRFFLGEWFLDTREGVPYYQEILVKNPDVSVVQTLLFRAVSETPGVKDLLEVEMSYDPSARTLFYSFRCSTDVNQDIDVTNSFILREAA